jgi:hypothetical protein
MQTGICKGTFIMRLLTLLFRLFLANLPFHVRSGRAWRPNIAATALERTLSRSGGPGDR